MKFKFVLFRPIIGRTTNFSPGFILLNMVDLGVNESKLERKMCWAKSSE